MATYRLSSKSISRSKGQSAVASASYRAGEKLHDKKLNKTFDYSRKQNIDYSEIILPTNANSRYQDRETLWNSVEKSEKRINSELSKEYQLSLPCEFSKGENIDLVKSFVNKQFIDKGLAVDMSFHNLSGENPHVHVMTTTRSFNESGDLGNKERFFKDRQYLVDLRKDWEIDLNQELEKKGIDLVTSESYKDRGIDLDAVNSNLKGQTMRNDLANQKELRSLKLTDNPNIIADILTDKKAYFGLSDLERFFKKNILPEHKEQAMDNLFKSENLMTLNKERNIYTSVNYYIAENKLLENAKELNTPNYDKEISIEFVADTVERLGLSEQQQGALLYATSSDSQIKNIEGYAGSGKSYTIGAIKDVYEQAGYNCKGIALSGIIADNLGKDAGIEDSRTIASFLYQTEKGNLHLDDKTVLFLDEASMVGVKDYQKITKLVKDAGAKLISVGDDNQLQAIQAGGASRLVKENSNFYSLDENRRQLDEKDKLATYNLSTNEQSQALEHYHDKGAIKQHSTTQEMFKDMTDKYFDDVQSGKSSMLLAFRKDTVAGINSYIHNRLKAQGKLGDSHIVNDKEYSVGDRFIFLQNDYGLNVRNGTTGKIELVKDTGEMQVKADDGRVINFNSNEYDSFSHAYAMTIHKSQGVSVDSTQLYFDDRMNSHLTLVGCTRHKENLMIHTLEKNNTTDANSHGIRDLQQMISLAEKSDTKELITDREDYLKGHISELDSVKHEIAQINAKDIQINTELELEIKDLDSKIETSEQKLQQLDNEIVEIKQEELAQEIQKEKELVKQQELEKGESVKELGERTLDTDWELEL